MAYHNGMYFTTKDSDNDKHRTNCAIDHTSQLYGGWWHKGCFEVNPNNYYNNHKRYGIKLNGKWDHTAPIFTEMKIRPHNCNI